MTRAKLTLAKRTARPAGPPLSLVKKALRLFAGRGVSRKTRHENARRWLKAMAQLQGKHILNKDTPAKWGRPGDPVVRQVFAPRRLGGK